MATSIRDAPRNAVADSRSPRKRAAANALKTPSALTMTAACEAVV